MSMFFPPDSARKLQSCWSPNADVYRAPWGWVIKFDLAGVPLDDVSIEVRDRVLRVSGVRRDWIAQSDWSYYSMEIAYSRFERTIQLPDPLSHARISTECQDGMLIIHIKSGKEHE